MSILKISVISKITNIFFIYLTEETFKIMFINCPQSLILINSLILEIPFESLARHCAKCYKCRLFKLRLQTSWLTVISHTLKLLK